MPHLTLKPIASISRYVIYAIVSYEENRGAGMNASFEEVCSGYHVFSEREALYFTLELDEAHAFIERKVAAFDARRKAVEAQRKQELLARPNRAAL